MSSNAWASSGFIILSSSTDVNEEVSSSVGVVEVSSTGFDD